MSRRRFLSVAALGGAALSGLSWSALAAASDEVPQPTAATGAAPGSPPEPTVYKLRNRWNQFLLAADGHAAYDKGADDDRHLWVFEPGRRGERIRNLGSGAYLAADPPRGDAVLLKPEALEPAGDAALWQLDVVSGAWLSIRNVATGKFLNCERQNGSVQCDGEKVPTETNWWLAQWEPVHVRGPKPPKRFPMYRISVLSPEYRAEVRGKVTVRLKAPGFRRVTARCWKQGEGAGADSTVATIALEADGTGSFVFPADAYPHGPVTLRLRAEEGDIADNCYVQLYNLGGVSWNEGIPKEPPAAARGMRLVFADDFDGPLSISSTDATARYYDHKPPDGLQDFSTLPFTSFDRPNNPFRQIDTYLRIRASEPAGSSGLISSMRNDGTGTTARAPCYFECRFVAPNAKGTWPAFWLMTDYMAEYLSGKGLDVPCDELDIIEAYGGEGPGSPNAFDTYMICPHCWNQGEQGKRIEREAFEALRNPIRMRKFGIPSTWYETFHTYGCKITETETIYYCDNVEVGRHPTLPLCRERPLFFMVNLARYDGEADMYVDYVRVYEGER
jgi:hypothetical protein